MQQLVPDSEGSKAELVAAAMANDESIGKCVDALDIPRPYSTVNTVLSSLVADGFVTSDVIESNLGQLAGNLQSEHISSAKVTECHDAVEAGELLSYLSGNPHGISSQQQRTAATEVYGKTLGGFLGSGDVVRATQVLGKNQCFQEMAQRAYGNVASSADRMFLSNPSRPNGSMLTADGTVQPNELDVSSAEDAAVFSEDPKNRGRLVYGNTTEQNRVTTKVEANGWLAATGGVPWGFGDMTGEFTLREDESCIGPAISRTLQGQRTQVLGVDYTAGGPLNAITSRGTYGLLPAETCGASGENVFPTGCGGDMRQRRVANSSGAHLSDVMVFSHSPPPPPRCGLDVSASLTQ